MLKHALRIIGDWETIVFPKSCICCGAVTPSRGRMICPFCLTQRFPETPAGMRPSTSDVILPESVRQQYALWTFDKGGLLQDLLHAMKYGGFPSIGEETGSLLGERLARFYLTDCRRPAEEYVLMPVPLHPAKKRMRGYNQARCIAKGMERTTGLPLLNEGEVERMRNTRSQTGFSVDRRMENVRGAFKIRSQEAVKGKMVIIVDDVFTTGATTFELASQCREKGAAGCFIATIAQA